MEDIKVLSEQIIARTKEAGQKKLADYQIVAQAEIDETEKNLEQSEKEQKESIELELSQDYERQVQTMINQQRNRILDKKQTLLNDVFDQAIIEIKQWDEKQFATFLAGVLSQIDKNKEWTFVPGDLSSDLAETEQVKTVLNKYSFVNVSNQVVNNKAGFILEQGGVDYNFTFEALMNELKKEFSPQLATLAFQNNE